jgi:hypothetical protein
MADGMRYPTSDHVSDQAEYEKPPYVDPNEARKAQLRAELDQLEAATRPTETPEEKAARLQLELAALEDATPPSAQPEPPDPAEARVAELQAKLDAAKAAGIPGA